MGAELPEAWATPAAPPPAPRRDGAYTIELPQSKAIARLHYEPATRSLVVAFRNGSAYRYFGVEVTDYTKLATSASPGARFNQDIAPYHEHERIA